MAATVVGSSVSANQLKDLFRQIADGSIEGEHMQAFLEHRDPFQKMVPVTQVAQAVKTRKGLYIHEFFTKRILQFAKGSDTADTSGCDSLDLPKNMSDREIIDMYLGGMEEAKKNAFTLNQLRTYLDNQWDGSDGPLLVNGYANIFYCIGEGGKLFAVHAARNGGEWALHDWYLGEHAYWFAGNRIFRNKR